MLVTLNDQSRLSMTGSLTLCNTEYEKVVVSLSDWKINIECTLIDLKTAPDILT